MPKIYSVSPYFDDYSDDKQFQQILFKPGKAVQARELTQLQTIAQKQVERFGDHIFKDGSIVSNCPFNLNLKLNFVKIQDLDASSVAVNLNNILPGFTLTGLTSGVTAQIKQVEDGIQTSVETKTFFIDYTSANGLVKTFTDGEQIEVRNTAGSVVVIVLALASNSTGLGSSFTLGEGIVYADGIFLKHLSQTIILDRYSTTPSYKVGFSLVESVVNSDQDESLLDPAIETFNYFAPGADRSKVATLLTKKSLDETTTENFFQVYEIELGHVKSAQERPLYSQILDALAERTLEESGDYTVRPFNVRIREHLNTGSNNGRYYANVNPLFIGNISGNANLLAVGVEPGIAYVKGYRVENKLTEYLPIEKGIEFVSEDAQPISFGYGNYVLCNELSGPWNIDSAVQVSLRDANAQSVTNQTYGATGAPGSQIGTARVKSLTYETGSIGLADCQYRVYLYDINLTANVPFSNVRSVYFNASSGSDSLADVVLVSGSAVLQESNFNTGVFRFPQRAMKTLRDTNGNLDNSFQFKKTFDVTIAVDGTFSITSPIGNEEFPYSAGALNATQKRNGFVVILNQSGTTTNLTGNITVSSGSNVITGNSTIFTTQLKVGDRITTAGGNTYRIEGITSATSANITVNGLGTETDVSYQKALAIGEYIDMSETGSVGTDRTITVASDTVANFDIKESLSSTLSAKVLVNLQKTDGLEIQKVLRQDRYVRINCNTSGTGGTYNLGFSDVYRIKAIYHGSTYSESNADVTNQFQLDNGQRDSFYTHGRIIKKPGSPLTLTSASRILVKLDYFGHDTSVGVGFFSVDSYPVDDTTDVFRTENIPVFVSPSSGESFDLRDSLDIRPRFTDTAADATSIAGATESPAAPSAISVPSGGLRVAVPNEEFNSDIQYYLSRKDRVYIDKDNNIDVIKGVSDIFPSVPNEPISGMSIAIINVPPYPSLSPQTAKASNRFDYLTKPTLIDNRRYTMKDIGGINQRINRLEYYTALNFLEKQANDALIPSAVTGLDRFKNGFLVDNFRGHGVGNTNDINYKVSVDPTKGELRPYFLIDNIDLDFNNIESLNVVRAPRDAIVVVSSATGTFTRGATVTQGSTTGLIVHVVGTKLYLHNVSGTFSVGASISTPSASATVASVAVPVNGDLVTLPYTHQILIDNPFATKPRNCVGELLFTWVGEINLTPPADNWVDTRTNPDLVVNFDNNLDNWLTLQEAWGTQWNDWETNWTGQTSEQTAVGGAVSVTDGIINQAQQTTTVTTVAERQSRSGTQLTVIPETVNYNLGNRVVDVSLIPFIRSQVVRFDAIRLKPNSRMFAFFDEEPVSQFCRPIGGNYGDALITSATGTLSGEFRIPNNDSLRFRVGQRLFKLIDDSQNRPSFQTTFAIEEFQASGLSQTQETTILSSRQARLGVNQVSDTRTIETTSVSISDPIDREVGRAINQTINNITEINETTVINNIVQAQDPDPIAQTFFIGGTAVGTFITKLDLYFRTKSPTLGITVQIREVVNGFPGARIVPFGSVTLSSADVNVSEDASAATPFTFPSPVFLQDGIEYCFVIIPAGNNPDYNIWVSEVGQNQLGTTNRVLEQPFTGILFTSANNRTWQPFQAEDVKFTLYRADFQTGTTGTIVLNNDNSDYVAITNLSNVFNAGDNVTYSSGTGIVKDNDNINNVLTILKDGTGVIKSKVIGTGNINASTLSNIVTGSGSLFNTEAYANAVIYVANTSTRLGKVRTISNDGSLTLFNNATENATSELYIIYEELQRTGDPTVSATVESLNDKLITLFDTNLSFIDFSVTNENWSYKLRDVSTNTISPSYTTFLLNQNTELNSEAKVASNSTEAALFSNTKSLAIKTEMSTNFSSVSPALDLFKKSVIVVDNFINNDSTGETSNAGNALARYISKQVILDEGQDAEDLKVFLSGYRPPGTDIEVFVRIANANDSTPFNDIDYIKLERVTSSIVLSDSKFKTDFKEYEYKFPSSVLTGPANEVQYTSKDGNTYTGFKYFAVKIILLSNNKAIVPKVKDYRAIALQI